MPCYGPLTGYRPKRDANSKRLVFDPRKSENGIKIPVPCGQCSGCRLDHAHDWAVRCMCELRCHTGYDSSFITLTMDDVYMKKRGHRGLDKSELQKFMKRLRHDYPQKVRFYGCGEYGERTERPHYHVLLFNAGFRDRKYHSQSPSGEVLYTSKRLRELWEFGNNIIGSVTFESCAYVAGYVVQKLTGDAATKYGDRIPPFALQSRKPGLGFEYFEKYGEEVYRSDSIVIRGREVSPPRYFDNKFNVVDSARFLVIKRKRRRQAVLHKADSGTTRLRVREVVALARAAQKKRTI